MQGQGQPGEPSNLTGPMPATDDEIREKYLERAIRELNHLTRDLQGCRHCPRGNLMPVLGSGHPQADVFLLKYAPQASEVEEGVAFYGRSGAALMKSFKRLGIDPLAVYGTLCVKCPVAEAGAGRPGVRRPRGRGAGDRAVRGWWSSWARTRCTRSTTSTCRSHGRWTPTPGVVQQLTPSMDALFVPNIDEALDEEEAKREFWAAFRVLGDWYAELPPY